MRVMLYILIEKFESILSNKRNIQRHVNNFNVNILELLILWNYFMTKEETRAGVPDVSVYIFSLFKSSSVTLGICRPTARSMSCWNKGNQHLINEIETEI